MFTGLIECLGTIISATPSGSSIHLAIKPDMTDFEIPIGSSVAVDGSCLTVYGYSGSTVLFSAVNETVNRTTLHNVRPGRRVNLERALKIGDRLDGHMVLGHVDGVGTIISDTEVGGSTLRVISIPEDLDQFMAEKGSVTIDGISLTIAKSGVCQITVSLIPLTIKSTSMSFKKCGNQVNLECDVLARYLKRISIGSNQEKSNRGDSDKSLLNTMERSGF